jgi:hypothetical protein
MLSGVTRHQIADVIAHKSLLEHAFFPFILKDNIMGIRRYRAQAAKKG